MGDFHRSNAVKNGIAPGQTVRNAVSRKTFSAPAARNCFTCAFGRPSIPVHSHKLGMFMSAGAGSKLIGLAAKTRIIGKKLKALNQALLQRLIFDENRPLKMAENREF